MELILNKLPGYFNTKKSFLRPNWQNFEIQNSAKFLWQPHRKIFGKKQNVNNNTTLVLLASNGEKIKKLCKKLWRL